MVSKKRLENSRDYVQTDVVKVTGITSDSLLFALAASGRQTTRVYRDGFGRTLQTVALQASPNGHDMVQPVVYDQAGRQSTGYLPYVTHGAGDGLFHSAALTEQAGFYNGGMNSSIARDAKPYAQQLFENSPLQRMYEAGSIGSGFQPVSGDHYKTVDYRTNASGDNVVVWNPDGSSSGVYSAGLLSVTIGTDEEHNQSLVFTNTNGQQVLKRQKGPSAAWLDTYYIYNDAGQVSYVVPPAAVVLMAAAGSYSITVSGVDALLFKMAYDDRGRLITKKVPGSGAMSVVYDPLDRPVLMQDASLAAAHQWNYIKYDVQGRAISQGIYLDATHTSQSSMQSYVDGLGGYATTWYESRSHSGDGYYTNSVFPTSGITPLAYSYYDNYYISYGSTADYTYSNQSLPGETATADTLSTGLLTAVRKTIVGSGISPGTWLVSVYFYDSKGRTIQTQSNNQLYGTVADKSTVVVDFTGKPTVSQVVKNSSGSAHITVQTGYTYDAGERVTAIDQKYNAGTAKRIASYDYNELGQLIKKNLGKWNTGTAIPHNVTLNTTVTTTTHTLAQHRVELDSGFVADGATPLSFSAEIKSDYLQGLDYRYSIRGQLVSMNNATLTRDTSNNPGAINDLFGMQLYYNSSGGMGNTAYYNGRLSAVSWSSRDVSGNKTVEKSYKYAYDELNRMTDALYQDKVNGNWNGSGAYDEKGVSYDANGNILTLKRNSLIGGAVTKIDSLVYSYTGNQLSNVTDGTGTNYTANGYKNLTGSADTATYKYDVNGNLITDPRKGITNHYNILNRVDSIRMVGTNKYISYSYSADGTLLCKKQYNSSGTLQLQTDYIDDFVYEDGALAYFATNEGRVRDSSGTMINEYVITDTQGNSRVSFVDNGSGVAVVRQENGYYPFGLIMNNGVTPGSQPNKNLYNGGSEWQNDYVDLPDYYQTFFRNYDAALGRWISVDPQADATESWTVYQYALNNPGMLNDPMGDLAASVYDIINSITSAGNNGGEWHSSNPDFVQLYGSENEELQAGFLNAYANGWYDQGGGGYVTGRSYNTSYALAAANININGGKVDANINLLPEDHQIFTPNFFDNGDFTEPNPVYTYWDGGPNDPHTAWALADAQIAKGVDLAAPIYEMAKFYAGGEFLEAGAAVSGLSAIISKGFSSLAGRFAPTVGDLAPRTAATFRFGQYTKEVLEEPLKLQRYFDGVKAFEKGSYMSNSVTGVQLLDRMGMAIRPSWNAMTDISTWEIPAGTTVYRGTAATQFPWIGGFNQYFIPNLSNITRIP